MPAYDPIKRGRGLGLSFSEAFSHLVQSRLQVAIVSFRTHPTFGAGNFSELFFRILEKLMRFARLPPHPHPIGTLGGFSHPCQPAIWQLHAISGANHLWHSQAPYS